MNERKAFRASVIVSLEMENTVNIVYLSIRESRHEPIMLCTFVLCESCIQDHLSSRMSGRSAGSLFCCQLLISNIEVL